MRQVLPLVLALVAAAVVFFMTDTGPVEACGRALVTFIIVLFLGYLVTRPRRKRE